MLKIREKTADISFMTQYCARESEGASHPHTRTALGRYYEGLRSRHCKMDGEKGQLTTWAELTGAFVRQLLSMPRIFVRGMRLFDDGRVG